MMVNKFKTYDVRKIKDSLVIINDIPIIPRSEFNLYNFIIPILGKPL
jgi:hypothetical protein